MRSALLISTFFAIDIVAILVYLDTWHAKACMITVPIILRIDPLTFRFNNTLVG